MPEHDPFTSEEAWMLELWKILEDGDPNSKNLAAEAIAALSQYLECSPSAFPSQTFDSRIC